FDGIQRPVPAAIDEALRLLEVARLPRDTRELGETDLDLGVAAHRGDAALTEHLAHEVGGAARDLNEAVIRIRTRARSRDGGLEEMPEAVELVAPLEVGPARLLSGPPEARVE